MKEFLRPGILAVRAVNQYRRRDVIAYLGLRYYLENTAARSDIWASEVTTDLVLTRTNTPYFQAKHFKEKTELGNVIHRPIFLPGANEALAEAIKAKAVARPEAVLRTLLSSQSLSAPLIWLQHSVQNTLRAKSDTLG